MKDQKDIALRSLLVLVILALAGCASPFDADGGRAWWEDDPATWAAHADNVQSDAEDGLSTDGRQTAGQVNFAADAGPDDYVQAALERNPAVRAAEFRVRRMGARIPQVTALDDPMLQIAPFGEMAQTAAGEVGVMTSVSQRLPLPEKLDVRGRIARQDVAMALAELGRTRLQVIADTRQAFWSYYFATRAVETTRDRRQLVLQFRQIAESQYRSGTRSQTDVLRGSVELSNLDAELVTLQQRQATARAMLNQLMNRPVSAELPAPAVVEPQQTLAELDDLLRAASTHNPAIRMVHQQIEQFRQRRRLAELSRWPDLNVSLSYNAVDDEGLAMAANGDDQWWLGFGVNLPIWVEKYEAAEREALQGMLENTAELQAAHNRVAYAVQEAYLKVEAQQKLVELFRDVVIPQARQTVEASTSGYRAGSVDFLTLVDNWRQLLAYELLYHRAVTDMHQAAADLQRAVGRELAQGVAPQPIDAPGDVDSAQPLPPMNQATPSPAGEEQNDG